MHIKRGAKHTFGFSHPCGELIFEYEVVCGWLPNRKKWSFYRVPIDNSNFARFITGQALKSWINGLVVGIGIFVVPHRFCKIRMARYFLFDQK